MPKEEQAICRRLREFHLFTGLRQVDFSCLVGLEHRLFTSYEYGRSQLNYPAARKILSFFWHLNPMWLAEGTGTMLEVRAIEYPELEAIGFGPRAPFSRVYKDVLRPLLLKTKPSVLIRPTVPIRLFAGGTDALGRLNAKEKFGDILAFWLAELPDEGVENFMDRLFRRFAGLQAHHSRDPDKEAVQKRRREMNAIERKRRFPNSESGAEEKGIDETSNFRNSPGEMKVTLKWLLDEVRRLTKPHGMKAQLADYLKVPPARVSEWLSGKHDPSGEMTLQILNWINDPKRKAK